MSIQLDQRPYRSRERCILANREEYGKGYERLCLLSPEQAVRAEARRRELLSSLNDELSWPFCALSAAAPSSPNARLFFRPCLRPEKRLNAWHPGFPIPQL